MNKNKILSGRGKNLTGGGKLGWRGRSGGRGGGKWGGKGEGSGGERGREVGIGYPPVHPLIKIYALTITSPFSQISAYFEHFPFTDKF